MPQPVSLPPISRRAILALAGAAVTPWNVLQATVYSDFWNKKDASKWSQDEIDRLTTKSPWAKEVTATYAPGSNNNGGYGNGSPNGNPNGGGYPGGQGGGMPRIGIGGIGMGGPRGRGMGGGRGGQGNGGSQLSTYKGTVRWESAQPILDALKAPLPDAFANHYVISIIDFPYLSDRRRQDQDQDSRSDSGSGSSSSNSQQQDDDKKMLDDIKQFTSLQPKDKDRAQPGIVQRQANAGSIFLFGFEKDFFDFGKNDHEVDFSTRLGRLVIRAKFDPRDMTYHKKLAV